MRIWRLIEDIPRTGSFNMAADQVLLENYSQDANPYLEFMTGNVLLFHWGVMKYWTI